VNECGTCILCYILLVRNTQKLVQLVELSPCGYDGKLTMMYDV
jgi:hypothetical protein